MKPFYEHLVGFTLGFIALILLFRFNEIAMPSLSLLSVFIASGVVPSSWDIRLIFTGYPFYAAFIGVLGGYLYSRLQVNDFIKRFILLFSLCIVTFISFFFICCDGF